MSRNMGPSCGMSAASVHKHKQRKIKAVASFITCNDLLTVVMDLICLCAVLLVSQGQTQGSSAVTPVFVQKGKDVTLDVMTDGFHEDDIVLWRFNTSSVIVTFSPGKEPIVSEVYTGRVEFPQKKYSVTLKNLQESDSGVYTAQLIGSAETQTVAEHKVTVQAPVCPVKLTVDSVSSSSDSCNLTVTCSTQDSDITSRVTCDTTTCHQEGGERSKVTTSGASLRLYLVNSTMNCNHSNQVSWTKDTKETGQVCPQFTAPVSPVKLTVDSVSNSSDSCNLTVTCSTQDSDITSRVTCDTTTCHQEGGESSKVTTSGASLRLYLVNSTINCNHSNQVSWTKDTKETGQACLLPPAPVSPVKLTVDSVSSSSDSCNLTVTCSTQDSDITSRVTCDTTTCHQEGGESSKVTTSGASLRLYPVHSTINCNHSNQVNWTNDTKETGQACLLPPDQQHRHVVIVPVLVGISVLILVFVLFLCYRRRRQWQSKPEVIENTVYAVPEIQPSPQTLDESSVNDASGPTTTYDLVGPHTGSTETRTKKPPESLYAQIEKPQRS
ncbi:uncharacterized protein LOC113134555 isoform X1 [Mastacembelus armatus]|uniref:uncharacterized protein LOC113134555 isoform X1 n=1 Tax=Mastacembelus armatus TaxID=205130 RepID=UPI000E4621F7|nr:uncharacterized protein LOC113134555 isoform X1 [Mastacembelus armatus]